VFFSFLEHRTVDEVLTPCNFEQQEFRSSNNPNMYNRSYAHVSLHAYQTSTLCACVADYRQYQLDRRLGVHTNVKVKENILPPMCEFVFQSGVKSPNCSSGSSSTSSSYEVRIVWNVDNCFSTLLRASYVRRQKMEILQNWHKSRLFPVLKFLRRFSSGQWKFVILYWIM
jgi:hypothetical protein